ncbi:MAG: hypothetical protein H5T85_04585 [Actinobacteria bacterium]|nr:hypothetical protein [Actinomycetota bacterium]
MNRNQLYHIFQWVVILVAPVELFLFLTPLRPWIVFVAIGIGYMVGFFLRVFKVYPGKSEPLWVDFLSAVLAFFASYGISFTESLTYPAIYKIFSPFFVLIPHFVYIVYNKQIHPPAILCKIAGLKVNYGLRIEPVHERSRKGGRK